MNRIIVSIYIDPDFYPPTINAILNLSEVCDELVVVTRNNSQVNYPFPSNVKLVKTGKYISVRDTESKGFGFKIISFIKFTLYLLKFSNSKGSRTVLLYDPIPLFSYYLLKPFLRKRQLTVWYHNHDMPDIKLARKYSIGWWATRYEHKAMQSVHIFSLPSDDRLAFYPNWDKNQNYFCIPNYPSLKVYNKSIIDKGDLKIAKLIFQGSIGEGHALEEVIELLQEEINGKKLVLILKGSVRADYKLKLQQLAKKFNVSDKLIWIGLGPYEELQMITGSCHIGLAIHEGGDNVSQTLGTASNKIYEYAACGLPVILYDSIQFRKYLEKYTWTFFSDTSKESLKQQFKSILENFTELSFAARSDFENELNFENRFSELKNRISNLS